MQGLKTEAIVATFIATLIILHPTSGQIEDFCGSNPGALQCVVLEQQAGEPKNSACQPDTDDASKKCQMNDLIAKHIADCKKSSAGYALMKNFEINPFARCQPRITSLEQAYKKRVVDVTEGEITCVPIVFEKKFKCGERGTRCVCDSVVPAGNDWKKHECRCQWFVDYCEIENICTESNVCKTRGKTVTCTSGSLNQCTANPRVCKKDEYCIELDDEGYVWTPGKEKEGLGFSCLRKDIFKSIKAQAPFCNYAKNDHVLTGSGFKKPINKLDYCCYQHLVCVEKGAALGGYLFQKRPCYCNVQFRNCLKHVQNDVRFKDTAAGLISVLNNARVCSMSDGKCNPKKPESCSKGDLISPSIAHCKVNCRSGPLLPIEIRACRIRQCHPPNNLPDIRIIDVPYHKESSLCVALENLPVTCGFENTRCVCDGQPSERYFTDRCRCQYWVEE